jgi:succinyl-CoA synthetase beta subunit
MYLLEHDAKELLSAYQIPVPAGALFTRNAPPTQDSLPPGPWIVKGQIAAGGRGKAGIIRKADTVSEAQNLVATMLGATVKNKRVESVRVEQQVADVDEAYIAFLIDAAAAAVRVIVCEQGGIEIESLPQESMRAATSSAHVDAITACVENLTEGYAPHKASALRAAAKNLSRLFIEREAALLEINPLFVRKNGGTWVAGDAKLVTDDNALGRQPALRELLARRAHAYPEAALKLEHGFDYVVVDPEGEIGLLTTGAGLSMMLIDELRAADLRPYNFLDIRTGGLRGETARIVTVLGWLAAAPRVRVVMINVFGGITDMGEFARLLVKALAEAPQLRVPVVARLAGNGLPVAQRVLAEAGIELHTELHTAIAEVRRHLERP